MKKIFLPLITIPIRKYLFTLLVLCFYFSNLVQAQTYIELILDASGSMEESLESGEVKIDTAKAVLTDFITDLPDGDLNVGLRIYGGQIQTSNEDPCTNSNLVVPISDVDKTSLLDVVDSTIPEGSTPIAYSLQQAVLDFQDVPAEAKKIIILVTDGEESCDGDLQAEVEKFRSQGIEVDLRIIGFGLSDSAAETFEGIGNSFENVIDAQSLETALNVAVDVDEPSVNSGEIIFQDNFERDELGDAYDILNPDPNRFAMIDGKLLIVAGSTNDGLPKNFVLLKQGLSGDFVATISVTMQVSWGNSVSLRHWIDNKNKLTLSIYGDNPGGGDGRYVGFWKTLNGDSNRISGASSSANNFNPGSIGNRNLKGYSTEPEFWYLQLERKGVKYTARVSNDGIEWFNVGTHTVLNKGGKLGFSAVAGRGIENAAEFNNFVVQEVE